MPVTGDLPDNLRHLSPFIDCVHPVITGAQVEKQDLSEATSEQTGTRVNANTPLETGAIRTCESAPELQNHLIAFQVFVVSTFPSREDSLS